MNPEIETAITISQTLEEYANQANSDGRNVEATGLFNQAADLLMPVMEHLTEPATKGRQAVRLVKLLFEAGKYTTAKETSESYVSQNSIPDISRSELENLISQITTLLPINRRSRGKVVTDPIMHLANFAEKILAASPLNFQQRLAHALNASIQIDVENDPPQPYSPSDIATDFGVPISIQRQYSICLTKDTALEFMNQLGIALTKDKLRKQFSERRYNELFGRPISSDGIKPFVFTYAEVLHMQELAIMIPFPSELNYLL